MSTQRAFRRRSAAPVGANGSGPRRLLSGRRGWVWLVVAGLAVIVLAGAAGFAIGRTTEKEPGPSSGAQWTSLSPAPVAGRIGEAVAWTGSRLVVAGGVTRSAHGKASPVRDGAAYDPASDSWRTIAEPPAALGAPAVWTGAELVTWSGNGPDGPAVGAVYTPRTDTWQRLPAGPLGPREGSASVWTGTEMLVIGGYRGDGLATPVAAAVKPTTGSWRVLTGLESLTLFGGPNGAVWDGRDVVIAGNLSLCPQLGSACPRRRPILVAYNPVTDTTRTLQLPAYSSDFGPDAAASLTPVAWTGTDVIFSVTVPGSVRILRYDPGTGVWEKGPYAPCYLPSTQYTQTAWIGRGYVAACGDDGLQVYSLATGTWRTITPGASPLNSREDSAIVWTGRKLIAWSGIVYRRFNPTPSDGASLVLGT